MKKVTEKHSYIYASGKLLRDTVESGGSTKILDFRYDQSGAPYSLTYTVGSTSTVYYYITNLQGDVMFMVDGSGNQVAAYLYDPYGKVLTATGTMAEINPLRYRGYYQDSETGFYYLQSRYYDPTICRFINADSYASTGQGLIGYNAFAYCNNNPTSCIDTTGNFPIVVGIIIAGALVGALAGAFSSAATGGSTGDIIESTIVGALTGTVGAVCGLGVGPFKDALTITRFTVAALAGGAIDAGVQFSRKAFEKYILNSEENIRIDKWRSIKVGLETGIGTLLPEIGHAKGDVVDAIGTAVAWGEGSFIIAAIDVAVTHIVSLIQDNKSAKHYAIAFS